MVEFVHQNAWACDSTVPPILSILSFRQAKEAMVRLFLKQLIAGAVLSATSLTAHAADVGKLSRDVVFGGGVDARAALDALARDGHREALPAIILGMRFNGRGALRRDYRVAIQRLSGEVVDDWFDAMLWQEGHPEVKPHPSFRQLKLESLEQIDPAFRRFLGGERSNPANMRIRLEEISWGGVRVDGIPSLDNPTLISSAQATYMLDDDLVFGIEINGDARAYPLRIMGWHEMFNDVIGGVPVALAYCTLCGAGVLYETTVSGQSAPLVFGSSGFLYRSNKLMFDRATDSLWNQFTGKPVAGPLVNSGIELRTRPVTITSWREWRADHPDTRVLSLNTGHRRNYGSGVVYNDYFNSPDLMFPSLGGGRDLVKKDYVFGLRVTAGAKAYPLKVFQGGRVINDRVGLQNVVLVGDSATRTVRAYDSGGRQFRQVGRKKLSASDGVWTVGEEHLTNASGQRLARLPGHIAYWFGWQSFVGGESEYYEGT